MTVYGTLRVHPVDYKLPNMNVPEADRPARDVGLEAPAQGSTLSGMCSIDDFPGAGHSVTVEWDEPQQSFVVTEIR